MTKEEFERKAGKCPFLSICSRCKHNSFWSECDHKYSSSVNKHGNVTKCKFFVYEEDPYKRFDCRTYDTQLNHIISYYNVEYVPITGTGTGNYYYWRAST